MVLRKERSLSSVGNPGTMSNEQPVTKRQRIEARNNVESLTSNAKVEQQPSTSSEAALQIASSLAATPTASTTSPDITTASISSDANDNHVNNSTDEVDRIVAVVTSASDVEQQATTAPADPLPLRSADHQLTNGNEMAEFEEYLIKQCLCGVSERALRKPFRSHYSQDVNGMKRVANLSEWPTSKLLQFLSNLQLLFDVYLKQNSKGYICSRVMDVCDALIRNDHNLIDEIIELSNFNNKYVQFLSGRVLASFLVIAKNNMDDNWLKKLVDNLFVFERLDYAAVQKMHFSLEIIKRIVEWKDVELHPLEDDAGESVNTLQTIRQPPIESNYFAINFNNEFAGGNGIDSSAAGGSASNSSNSNSVILSSSNSNQPSTSNATSVGSFKTDGGGSGSSSSSVAENGDAAEIHNGCHIISLTDSESFDTTHLKCITIKILENKWPALVKNMSNLISSHHEIATGESCILTFLCLWENIISVKANLSIVETLPFYAQLDKFELLLNQSLSCAIYTQMLSLLNEALCYGSTLALQDLLPEETCLLAHQIVRHVKDFRILDSMPRRHPENTVSFIGYKGSNIIYQNGSLEPIRGDDNGGVNGDVNDMNISLLHDMDKTILQKMVLLVLKSVAVTVKEIRSDSSDSSIDSADYDAFQDMVLIERSIRDVLKKLESFIKTALEFHPESHFSKILIHLFDDQDDHLIEAMVCTLDVTAGISFRNNAFPELVAMLNPVFTFLEFLKMISNSSDLLLDLLVSNETCFLLYLLRFLKYIRLNWSMFVASCQEFGMGTNTLDDAMSVLIRLRLQISRLVSKSLYPYDISPVLRLLESCECLYEGSELS